MIIVDILEIMKFRSPLLMLLSMQSLRNESEELPNMPRQLMLRLINFTCLYSLARSIRRGRYFSSLRRALLFKFVSKPTVNSIIYRTLSAVERIMSGRRLSPEMPQGER